MPKPSHRVKGQNFQERGRAQDDVCQCSLRTGSRTQNMALLTLPMFREQRARYDGRIDHEHATVAFLDIYQLPQHCATCYEMSHLHVRKMHAG